ncbi:MFS transporter [Mycobacterium sp. pW045]|uniref:MFS transporter n=1 Tax=Mycobacterium sp. pW045 TaxID=3238984 RepID=UPI00351BDFB6
MDQVRPSLRRPIRPASGCENLRGRRGRNDRAPVDQRSRRLPIACAALLVVGIGLTGALLLPNAMLADAVARDAETSHQLRSGAIVGLWSAAETIAAAAGAGVYGIVLSATGFISSSAGAVVDQPRTAQWGIVLGFSITACGCLALAHRALTTLTNGREESERTRRDGATAHHA